MIGSGSAIGTVVGDDSHIVAKIGKDIGAKSLFNKKLLIELIMKRYSFPENHRPLMWRYILRIPMNDEQYTTLASQPVHPTIRLLPNSLPIRFSAVSHRLMRILSALVYWHPPLAECDWLPALVYPFLVIFGRDKLATFEVIMTVITNWCSEWLHFIPNPPITILSRIDKIARRHGGEAPLARAWPALRSFCGEVASTEVAKMILDNILSFKPVFIEYLIASYALLKPGSIIDEFNYKFVINRARKFFEQEAATSPNQNNFSPLPHGYYPILPIVEKSQMWREKELQRIRSEAEQTRQQAALVKEIEQESTRIEMQRQSWMAERQFLRDIEEIQMDEFRRREKEQLMRENLTEERQIAQRLERMKERKIEEENAITEWQDEIKKVEDETKQIVDMRRENWGRWLNLKEESAKVDKQQVDQELYLLQQKENLFGNQLDEHKRVMDEAAQEEAKILGDAVRNSQKLEDEKNDLRQSLERTRRNQEKSFSFTRQKL